MVVITFETNDGKTRYYLADDNAVPIQPVLNYLRFEDDRGLARNTLRLHCIHMKHFYSFLEQKDLKYTEVTVDHLAEFVAWLKYPRIHEKVIPILLEPAVRAQTINANVDTVLNFYILPSSLHECIAIPQSHSDLGQLAEMVYEINMTQVELQDRLSTEVYQYDM